MKKSILILGMLILSVSAVASPGDDGCIGNCPQSGSSQNVSTVKTNNTALGVGISGAEAIISDNVLKSNSNSKSSSKVNVEVGDTSALSGSLSSVGNTSSTTSVGNTTSNSSSNVGDTTSSSSIGDTNATVGDVSSHSGDSYASTGDSSATSSNEGNTIQSDTSVVVQGDVWEAPDLPAASAASVFAVACQNGASGQLQGGGFSIIQTDQFCQHVESARFAKEMYILAVQMGDKEEAEHFKAEMYDNTRDALSLVEASEVTAHIDRQAGFLTRPLALLGALIWLL